MHIHPYTLQLKHTFRIAHGSRNSHDTVVVELMEDGISGFGEASSSVYFKVFQNDLLSQLETLKPRLASYRLDELSHFSALLRQWLPQSPFLRSALDMAAHDLVARRSGVSTRELMGIETEDTPLSCFTIGMGQKEEMAKRIEETPWPVYKLKMGGEEDVETLHYLRKVTEAPFQLDANGAWDLAMSKRVCDLAEVLNIHLLEQPMNANDWSGHLQLREYANIPIVADEACMGMEDVAPCRKSYDGINIKLPKCGGLMSAVEMIKQARSLDLLVMMGCMTESSIGISGIAQLAPLLDHVDLDGAMLLSNDPAEGVKLESGRIIYPSRVGNGSILLAR